MSKFRLLRYFKDVAEPVASVLRELEANVTRAVDDLTATLRPRWTNRSTAAATTIVNPWDFLRVTVTGRVILPAPTIETTGTEVVILLGSGVTATVTALIGNVNGAASYTATGGWVYKYICSGEGWYTVG